jgi:hypothetical protein
MPAARAVAAVKAIHDGHHPPLHRLQVFEVDAATSTVNFSPVFSGNLFDAIAAGSNAGAGACIDARGPRSPSGRVW